MSENYLNAARANGAETDSNTSEAELIESNDALKEAFQSLTAARKVVTDQKTAVLTAIDDQHKDVINQLEAQYAMMLSLSR